MFGSLFPPIKSPSRERGHAASRRAFQSRRKTTTEFQLRIVGVTRKTRDSDFGRSPLVRCGKYVSPACTLALAPVQVRDTFGVLLKRLKRASLKVSFGKDQGRLRFVAATILSSAIRRILRHLGLRSIAQLRPLSLDHAVSGPSGCEHGARTAFVSGSLSPSDSC